MAERRGAAATIWPSWARRAVQALEQIPWLAITTLAIIGGSALQFAYFKSIGHVPSDLGALTSLSVATAGIALATVVVLAAFLVLPSIVARSYAADGSIERQPIGAHELLSAQSMAVGIFMAEIVYDHASQCDKSVGFTFYASVALGAAGGCYLLWSLVRPEHKGMRGSRAWQLVVCGLAALTPLVAVIPIGQFLSDRINREILILSVWVMMLAINALTVHSRLSFPDIAVGAAMLVVLLYVALPMGTNKVSTVTFNIAELVGVKSEVPVTVLLSKQACLLFDTAAQSAANRKPTGCEREHDNVRTAVIWSNVGSRWVLSNPSASHGATPFTRVTLPAEGVHVVHQLRSSSPTSQCTP